MRKKSYRYFRRMRTQQERTAGCEYQDDGKVKWGRPKRSGRYLDPWNLEKCPHTDSSWKAKRKTQYYPGGKGKRHEIIIDVDNWRHELDIKQAFKKYCENHHIPYDIEEISTRELKTHEIYKNQPIYNDENLVVSWEQVKTGETRKYWSRRVFGVKLVWWHDKNIRIDRIINVMPF